MRSFLNIKLMGLLWLSCGPLQAQDKASPPAEQAAQVLEQTLGAKACEILSQRQLALFGDEKKRACLLHAQWPVLESLASRAKAWMAFISLYETLRSSPSAQEDLPELSALQKIPVSGIVTDQVKAALELVSAHLENASALGKTLSPGLRFPLLYRTAWGKRFLETHRADLVADFRPLASSYFEDFLSGPNAGQEAQKHFLGYLETIYDQRLDEALHKAQSANAPSQELIGWIAKYLLDQKRLLNLARTQERLAKLEKSGLQKDLKDLNVLASQVAKAPQEFLQRLKNSLGSQAPNARVRFASERLHAHGQHGETLDMGDSVDISLAYWVDGLKEGESTAVTEIGFVDAGASGISHLIRIAAKRKNGGPYIFKTSIPLRDSRPLFYRFLLSAPDGASLKRDIEITPSTWLEEDLAQAARAENLILECQFEEGLKALDALASDLGRLSAEKSQFGQLRSWAKKRSEAALKQLELRKKLMGFIPGARLHASKEQCDFQSGRVQQALALLKELTPGCDRLENGLSLELRKLYRWTERRRLHQEAFKEGARKARKLEESCRAGEAAQMYAAALALLDADPASRCGPWEREHREIRIKDIPRARVAELAAQGLEKEYQESSAKFASGNFSGALEILNPLVARIDSIPDNHCYKSLRRKAEELALAAGISLAPLETQELKRTLPKDDIDEVVFAVNAERKKILREEQLGRERELQQSSPSALPVSVESADSSKPATKDSPTQ